MDQYYATIFFNEQITEKQREQMLNKLNQNYLLKDGNRLVEEIREALGWVAEIDNTVMYEQISNLLATHTKLVEEQQQQDKGRVNEQIGQKELCILWVHLQKLDRVKRQLTEEDHSKKQTAADYEEYKEEQCSWFGNEGKLLNKQKDKNDQMLIQLEKLKAKLQNELAEFHFQSIKSVLESDQFENVPEKLEELFRKEKMVKESELAFQLRIAHIEETREAKKREQTEEDEEDRAKGKGKAKEAKEKGSKKKKQEKRGERSDDFGGKKKMSDAAGGNVPQSRLRRAKQRMRAMLSGENNRFMQLAEAHPMAMAIDVFEPVDLEEHYIRMLANPQADKLKFVESSSEHQLSRVHLQQKIWDLLVQGWHDPTPKNKDIKKELEQIWREKCTFFVAKIEKINEKKVVNLLSILLDALISIHQRLRCEKLSDFKNFVAKNFKSVSKILLDLIGENVPKIRSFLMKEHETALSMIYNWRQSKDDIENRFHTFLTQTRGARSRLELFFYNYDTLHWNFPKIVPMVNFELTGQMDIDEQTIKFYRIALNSKQQTWERTNAKIAADILVHYKMVDECFRRDVWAKKGYTHNWDVYSNKFMLFIDRLADAPKESMDSSVQSVHFVLLTLKAIYNNPPKEKRTLNLFTEVADLFDLTKAKIADKILTQGLQNWQYNNVIKLLDKYPEFGELLSSGLDADGDRMLLDIIGKWPGKIIGRPQQTQQNSTEDEEDLKIIEKYKYLLEMRRQDWSEEKLFELNVESVIYYFNIYIKMLLEIAEDVDQTETDKLKREYLGDLKKQTTHGRRLVVLCKFEHFLCIRLVKNKVLFSNAKWISKLNVLGFEDVIITEGFFAYVRNNEQCHDKNTIELITRRMNNIPSANNYHMSCIVNLLTQCESFRKYFYQNRRLRAVKRNLSFFVGDMEKLEKSMDWAFNVENQNRNIVTKYYLAFIQKQPNQLSASNGNCEEELNIRAAIFYYENMMRQLLLIANPIWGLSMENNIKIEYENMMERLEGEEEANDRQILCKQIKFIVQNIVKHSKLVINEKWREEVKRIKQELRKNHLADLLPCEIIDKDIFCEAKICKNIVHQIVTNCSHREYIHFACIKQLLSGEVLEEFVNRLIDSKESRLQLGSLVGGHHFGKLQSDFPDLLKFDELAEATKEHLYRQILLNKTGSSISLGAEIRMTVVMLLNLLGEVETGILRLKSSGGGKPGVDQYYNALLSLSENVKDRIFDVKNVGVLTMKSICLLVRTYEFLSITAFNDNIAKFQQKNLANQFSSWTNKCAMEQEQNLAFGQQRKFLSNEHQKNLSKFLVGTDEEEKLTDEQSFQRCIHFLMGTNRINNKNKQLDYKQLIGVQNRIKRLLVIDPSRANDLIGKCGLNDALKIDVFSGQSLLHENYKEAIGHSLTNGRLLSKLAADLFVWVRYIDSLLFAAENLHRIWQKIIRSEYSEIYDWLNDKTADELKELDEKWLLEKHIRFMRLRTYFEDKINAWKSSKRNEIEWIPSKLEREIARTQRKMEMRTDEEEFFDFSHWLKGIHLSELCRAIETNAQLKVDIAKALGLDGTNVKTEEVAELALDKMWKEQFDLLGPLLISHKERNEKESTTEERGEDSYSSVTTIDSGSLELTSSLGEASSEVTNASREEQSPTPTSRTAQGKKGKQYQKKQSKKQSAFSELLAKNDHASSLSPSPRSIFVKKTKERKEQKKLRFDNNQKHTANRESKLDNLSRKISKHLPSPLLPIYFIEKPIDGDEEHFYGVDLLNRKYLEFLLKPDIEKQTLLTIGAFANEISHRMDSLKNVIINSRNVRELPEKEKKWIELKEKLEKPIKTMEDSKLIINSLNSFLCELITSFAHLTAEQQQEQQTTAADEEKNNVKCTDMAKGLHWNKLANAISEHHLGILSRMRSDVDNKVHQEEEKENDDQFEDDGDYLLNNWQPLARRSAERNNVMNEFLNIWLDYTEKQRKASVDDVSVWYMLTREERAKAFGHLFGTIDKVKLEALLSRFAVHLSDWMRMLEQTNLDEQQNIFSPILPEYNQQLEMSSIYETEMNKDQSSRTLVSVLRSEQALSEPMEFIEEAIETLKDVLYIWDEKVRLLVSGSYALNVHTAGSDIDCILVAPDIESSPGTAAEEADQEWETTTISRFFGQQNTDCDLKKREECADKQSLFCLLCLQTDVSFLRKITGASVPLIQLVLNNVEFDLAFVSISGEILNAWSTRDEMGLEALDLSIGRFIVHIGQNNLNNPRHRKVAMLRSLSGYRSTIKLRKMLKVHIEDRENNFRYLLLALKNWSKNHFIYGGLFGFLNGSSLLVLVCKIFLLYPGASISYLIEQFYLTLLIRKWPTPFQLENSQGALIPKLINKKHRIETNALINWQEIDWNLKKEQMSKSLLFNSARWIGSNLLEAERMSAHASWIWLINPPGFPSQNAAFNINKSTGDIIRSEIQRGFTHFTSAKRMAAKLEQSSPKSMNINIRNEWRKWLVEEKDFQEKYSEYLLISCFAADEQVNMAFCDFAKIGIRLQLVYKMESIKGIKNCHAKELMRNQECPPNLKRNLNSKHQSFFILHPNMRCTIWLVGVEQQYSNPEWEKAKRDGLFNKFNRSFTDHYVKKDVKPELGGSFIETNIINKKDLNNWLK